MVSYLNTVPLIHGIRQDKNLVQQIQLNQDIPSECARKLISEEVDLGLIPVAVIPQLKKPHIISDYCIGAVGKVKSVLLLSDVPLTEIESIYLDYHSRTSVALCRLLCKEFWNISPNFIKAEKGFETRIEGTTAGVIIGDRTFFLPKDYQYQFDLAEEWQKMTNLPFVFAAWVSNKALPQAFIQQFNNALQLGLNNTSLAIEQQQNLPISKHALHEYLTRYIQFDFDTAKKDGLALFLEKLKL